MRQRILSVLNRANTDGWRINTVKTQSYELFFVHNVLETVRATDTQDVKVTVYARNGEFLGDSTFPVYASYTDDKISSEVEKGLKKALAVKNPAYLLPDEGVYSQTSDSNLQHTPPEALAARIADAVFAASCCKDGSVNALEVFLYRDEVNVVNHLGTDKSEVRYRAMIEAIPTWNSDEESVEIYENYSFTEFDPAQLTAEIDRKMNEVKNRCLAGKPTEKISCPVVLNPQEISSLLYDITGELNYAAVYNHTNAYEVGKPIQIDPKGDALTVTMRGKIKGAYRSASFDADGTAMADTQIIRDGVAVDTFGASRFAQYLGKKPTGNLPCFEVAPGTLSEEELKSAPYFECVSMSGLQVDIYNDYIGGEVRLAYYFDGEKTLPLTGISISGKLSDALQTLRLSQTETVYGAYKGPDRALLGKIEIV